MFVIRIIEATSDLGGEPGSWESQGGGAQDDSYAPRSAAQARIKLLMTVSSSNGW